MPEFYMTVDAITEAFTVPGIILNLLLLYLIRSFSRKEIGSYANLLTLFASYDVILIVLNYMLIPRAIAQPYVLAVVLEVHYGSPLLTCFHSVSFMVSYAILITHFIYRYWIVTHQYKIELFSTIRFYTEWLLCIIIFCTALITASASTQAQQSAFLEYQHKFNGTVREGWVVLNYVSDDTYNWPVVFLTLLYDFIGSAMLYSVAILASLTYRRIGTAFALSPRSRSFQTQLLVAACTQTIIPVICVSLPISCNMNMPMIGYPLPAIADCSSLFLALFPVWDPLAIILLVKPYRNGCISLFMKFNQSQDFTSTTQSEFTVKSNNTIPNNKHGRFIKQRLSK